MACKILVPVRYAAWLSGEMGQVLQTQMENGVGGLPESRVTRMPRGFLVEAEEADGPFLEAVRHAVAELEEAVQARYPVFWREMGPVWSGSLQALFVPMT